MFSGSIILPIVHLTSKCCSANLSFSCVEQYFYIFRNTHNFEKKITMYLLKQL